MGRIFHHAGHARAVRRWQAFLHFRQLFYRQISREKTFQRVKAHAKRDGELALGERIAQLALVAADEEILLDEFFKITLALDVPEKRPNRLTRAGSARIEQPYFAFPLGLQ